ncbi:MAG: prepilin-type N-terminal cleavage/methylation domain-containing protein [Candidatus Eisenbacteria bacterium]|uniref:Prepilin-type N-terminal cleavage/methylation domain-containing protein n=1 Tax=Eiseniibacteriota bacterium TaxID=2212470 RepID=A0A933SBW6_UNCEI|nr:prepilin-type N-terminal cleavage/methylation domain-containing protein [Candidatus Eisenbacteria bacterium]
MTARRQGPDRCSGGFSLVELIVTIAILATVLLVASKILIGSNRMERNTAERADVQAAARQTLFLMTSEIRQAGADPSSPPVGIVGIVSADSVRLRVRADLNGNGTIQTAEPSEDVTYSWSDTSGVISRDPGTGAIPLLSGVTSLRVRYFDATNTEITALPLSTTDAARVRSVALSFTSASGSAQPLTLSTRITLRNM